jgi:hypothetical protein
MVGQPVQADGAGGSLLQLSNGQAQIPEDAENLLSHLVSLAQHRQLLPPDAGRSPREFVRARRQDLVCREVDQLCADVLHRLANFAAVEIDRNQ